MKNKTLVILLMGLMTGLIMGCTDPKDPTNPLLQEENMVDFLFDLHMYESMISERYIPKEQSAIHYRAVFDKHHVTAQQFDSALTWYEGHHRIYEKIYVTLKERYDQEIQKIESGIYQYYNPPIPSIWLHWGQIPPTEVPHLSYAQYTYYLQLPASELRTHYGRCYPYIERFAGSTPFWKGRNQ